MALTKSRLQRGPEGRPAAAAQGYWIRQHDRTTIIDSPHAGDALESTLSLQEDRSFPGQAKHMVVDFTYKSAAGVAADTIARASTRWATQLVNQDTKLHKVAWENAIPVLTPYPFAAFRERPTCRNLEGCAWVLRGVYGPKQVATESLPGARI